MTITCPHCRNLVFGRRDGVMVLRVADHYLHTGQLCKGSGQRRSPTGLATGRGRL